MSAAETRAPQLATDLGKNGNSLVHVIASSEGELANVNKAIASFDDGSVTCLK